MNTAALFTAQQAAIQLLIVRLDQAGLMDGIEIVEALTGFANRPVAMPEGTKEALEVVAQGIEKSVQDHRLLRQESGGNRVQ